MPPKSMHLRSVGRSTNLTEVCHTPALTNRLQLQGPLSRSGGDNFLQFQNHINCSGVVAETRPLRLGRSAKKQRVVQPLRVVAEPKCEQCCRPKQMLDPDLESAIGLEVSTARQGESDRSTVHHDIFETRVEPTAAPKRRQQSPTHTDKKSKRHCKRRTADLPKPLRDGQRSFWEILISSK